jgi:O-methyltransferase/8-demethyl-8-(2,3-dimethoxy-alpha-L-rhamnosyl)tetracenomycin-C 4'-O-methyltransferase
VLPLCSSRFTHVSDDQMTTKPSDTRPIEARGPGASADELRAAYLDLLKLTLCDLANARTESVMLTIDHTGMFSKQSTAEELGHRATGMHWSLHGLTMVGLTRLDDLQRCVESVVRDGVEGDLIEAGVWRGGASILMRATLDSLGEERTLWLADSFEGFPEPDEEAFPADHERDLSRFDFLSAPVDEVRGNFARLGLDHGLKFVPGFFDETMPGLRGGTWSLVRLDSDTYEGTRLALDSLYPGLSTGGHLIVDDYHLLPECQRAVDDYRSEHGIEEPLESIDWNSVRWRRESPPDESDRGATTATPTPRSGSARSGALRERLPVPTEREQALEAEIARLREELQNARAELEGARR